jgi:hypothetical protein
VFTARTGYSVKQVISSIVSDLAALSVARALGVDAVGCGMHQGDKVGREASKHPSRPAAAAYINIYIYIDTGRHGTPPQVDTGRRHRSGRSGLATSRVGGGRQVDTRHVQVGWRSCRSTCPHWF